MVLEIEKRRLGQQAFALLSKKIIAEEYPPGTHLSEISLCSDLGISRTPIREALIKLEEQGLVISRPNKGFFIAPLNKGIVRDHYPILAALDALALKSSRNFTNEEIVELEELNEKMVTAEATPLELYQLDLDFHDKLTNKCENCQLLSLIETLKAQTRRYDGGYKRGLANRKLAYQEHVEIINALKNKDNVRAAGLLEEHWLGGIKTVTEWIDHQESREKTNDHL